MKIAIVTDSNSGIDNKISQKLGIYIIPMPVIIENHTYFEGIDISRKEFFEAQLMGKSISSSQPNPLNVSKVWDEVLQHYDELVYIPMSSGLSGSVDTAKTLAKDYNDKVYVVDNHRISVTLNFSVYYAIKLVNLGHSALEIKNILENDAYNSNIYIAVDTLKYLKKGGRITSAAATMINILNFKPILKIHGGKLDAFKISRSIKNTKKNIIEAVHSDIENHFKNIGEKNMIIGTASSFLEKSDAIDWYNTIKSEFPLAKVIYNPLSLSIACHVGPNAIGIGYAENKI